MNPKSPPRDGKVYICALVHADGDKGQDRLRAVNEDDCDWRTADDNSPVSYDWTVVSWQSEKETHDKG